MRGVAEINPLHHELEVVEAQARDVVPPDQLGVELLRVLGRELCQQLVVLLLVPGDPQLGEEGVDGVADPACLGVGRPGLLPEYHRDGVDHRAAI